MNRRKYLLSLSGGIAALTGCIASGESGDGPKTELPGDAHVSYEHDDLQLRALQETVRRGETIEFEVTNTSSSPVALGCHNPWAIQAYVDGQWHGVTGTPSNYYDLCLTQIAPSSTLVESVSMSNDALESQAENVSVELTPGTYRFVLLGPSPFLAVDFQVTSSDENTQREVSPESQ